MVSSSGQASEKWRSKQCIGPSYSPCSHIKIDFRKYGSYMSSSSIVNVRGKIMIPLWCEGARLINFSDIWPCPWLAELCWVKQTVKGNIGHLGQIMASVCMKTSVTIKMMQWQQSQCFRCLMFCSAQNWSRPDRWPWCLQRVQCLALATIGIMTAWCPCAAMGCLPSPG